MAWIPVVITVPPVFRSAPGDRQGRRHQRGLAGGGHYQNKHVQYKGALNDFRREQTESVLANSDPRAGDDL
jgi:hypothetical protein